MTQTEQIIAAIESGLNGAGIAARTDIVNPYTYTDVPAILIDCGNEAPEPGIGGGAMYWDLTVTLWSVAAVDSVNTAPKMAPENLRKAAHEWLMAHRDLGGLVTDIAPIAVNRLPDYKNAVTGFTASVYRIKYRIGEDTI